MENSGILTGFLTIYSLIGFFTSIIGLVLFVIKGFAIFDMSKKLNLKKNYLGFIPVVSVFAFGRIAEKYRKKDGSKSAKFSVILLIFNILQYLLAIVFIAVTIYAVIEIYGFAENAIIKDVSMELYMFSSLIPVIICYFILFAVSVAYTVLTYVSFWRICEFFNKRNATLYTFLSVIFPFLMPIFLFIIRKNEPQINEI